MAIRGWCKVGRLRNLAWAAFMLSLMTSTAAPNASAQADARTLQFEIRVNNYSTAPAKVLERTERNAALIFAAAGLRVNWLSCRGSDGKALADDPCAKPLRRNELVMRVVEEPPRSGYAEDVYGFAVVPLLATLFYGPARRRALADNAEYETATILGCAMAHEIGHLLLGQKSHADRGLMQARWDHRSLRQALMGTLLFTPEQSLKLTAEVQAKLDRTKIAEEWLRLPRTTQ
jgi:hypothetical protein